MDGCNGSSLDVDVLQQGKNKDGRIRYLHEILLYQFTIILYFYLCFYAITLQLVFVFAAGKGSIFLLSTGQDGSEDSPPSPSLNSVSLSCCLYP